MSEAKIRLSQKEREMVSDADLILTKNAILQKVNQLLAGLLVKQQDYLASLEKQLPFELLKASPKISKGENYKGLPYLILDYPRYFEPDNILAIRTMFWWGNFFSITLHVSGAHKKRIEERISKAYHSLGENGCYFSVSEDQWQHHFETTNYRSLSELPQNDFETLLRVSPFIKLANKIPLPQWDDAEEMLLQHFKKMIELLAA